MHPRRRAPNARILPSRGVGGTAEIHRCCANDVVAPSRRALSPARVVPPPVPPPTAAAPGGAYSDLVLRRPWLVILPVLLLTAYLGIFQLPHFRLEAGSQTLMLEGDDTYRVYEDTRGWFTDDDYALVAIQPPDVWTPDGVGLVAELTAELEALPGVESVLSPTNVPLFLSRADGTVDLHVLTDPEVDLAKAREELTTSEVYVRNVISDDGTKFNLLAYFAVAPQPIAGDRDHPDNVDARRGFQRTIVGEIRSVLDRYRERGAVVHSSGLPSISVDMVDYIEHDISSFGFAVAGLLLLALAVFFRRPRFVILPVVTCVCTVVCVMGAMVVAGVETTVVSSNISSLLFIVGMAHSIHIVVVYREERGGHPERPYLETLHRSIGRVAKPCLYTALTTAAGFLSLLVTDVAPVKDFGIWMAIGTLFAFCVSLTFLPACLACLRPTIEMAPRAARPSRLLQACAALAIRSRPAVYAVTLATVGCAAWGISLLRVDASFIDFFVSSTEVHQGIKWVDQVGGTMTLDVILPGEDDPNYWVKEENFAAIVALHDWFDAQPEVGKTMSLASIERYGRRVATSVAPFAAGMKPQALFFFFGQQAKMRGRPEALESATSVVLSRQRTEDEAESTNPRVPPIHRAARVQVRLRETTIDLRREEFLLRLDAFIAGEPTLQGRDVVVTGMFKLFTRMLETVVGSQVRSFGIVLIGCAVVLVILMWHVGAGLLMMIPNVLPIALVLGTMGATGITLDIMTITIASVSLGIAVDSAIHYVTRFRREVRASGEFEAATRAAHASIGRAILYTALTVIAGFLVLAFSKFTPTIYFGVLVGVAMVTGLLSNLILLPSLLLTFRPFRDDAQAGASTPAADSRSDSP